MVKCTGGSIKPYRQPFDHFFTLKTLWHKVIHNGEMAKRAPKQADGGGGGKNLGWGPRIFPAGRKADKFFTALFGFGILNLELLLIIHNCKIFGGRLA
jgi:hypothetical protein